MGIQRPLSTGAHRWMTNKSHCKGRLFLYIMGSILVALYMLGSLLVTHMKIIDIHDEGPLLAGLTPEPRSLLLYTPNTTTTTTASFTNGGGLFYCGFLDTATQVGQAVFPDFAHRYEGGYDLQSHKDIGAEHYPRHQPHSMDILIFGMHGPCATPLRNFPGKVLVVNGEPNGGDTTKHIVLKGRNWTEDIFQIGSVPDANNTVLSYFVVWDQFLFRYMKEGDKGILRSLSDHNHKPINTEKYNALIYTNSNCKRHREEAVNEISAIMPIHVGGTCQGAKPHKGTFLPVPDPQWYKSRDRRRKHNNELYKDYKFCFAMENTYQDQYITEKILFPFLAGCIPVYYGTKDVFNLFNHKAMVYYDPQNPAPALKQLQELAHNETLYHEMLHNQPILAQGNETLKRHFSLLDGIEGGHLKQKIRTTMGVS